MATDTSGYDGRSGQDNDLYASAMTGQQTYSSPSLSHHTDMPDNMFSHSSSYIQSPTPQESQFPSGVHDMGRDDEIILPKWQSDAEVANCPICDVKFSLWTRKHHCRKCGRVVCANCSPHRITIPTQYIVRPEPSFNDPQTPVIDLTGDDDVQFVSERPVRDRSLSRAVDPTLSGGQEVRICNPCVPDPNTAPPPQPGYDQYTGQYYGNNDLMGRGRDSTPRMPQDYASTQFFLRESVPQQGNRGLPNYGHSRAMSAQERYMGLGPAGVLPIPEWNQFHERPRARASSQSQSSALHSRVHFGSQPNLPPLPPVPQYQPYRPPHPPRLPHEVSFTPGPRMTPPQVPPRGSSYVQPLWGLRPGDDVAAPPTRRPQPPQPQPQLREEDYCPICQHPLPAKGPDGNEEEREAHVASCEEQYFGTSAHPQSATASARESPLPSSAFPAHIGHSHVQPSASASSSSSSFPTVPPASARRHTASGPNPMLSRRLSMGPRMITYLATEKDCEPTPSGDGEEGAGKPNPAETECVICFEDFEVGVELARLECLCRFHKKCIRDWWDVKGKGSCPIHLNWQ